MGKLILLILKHKLGKKFNDSATIKLYFLKYILYKQKLLSVKRDNALNIDELIKLVMTNKLKITPEYYNSIHYKDIDNYNIYIVEVYDTFEINNKYMNKLDNNFELKTTIYPLYNFNSKSINEELMERLEDKLDIKNNQYEHMYLKVTNILKLLTFA